MVRTKYGQTGMRSVVLITFWLFDRIVGGTHASHETGAETEAKACNKKRGMCDGARTRQDDNTERRPRELVMEHHVDE